MKRLMLAWCLTLIACTVVTPVFAEQMLVAVAANFIPPFRELAIEFEKSTGHQLKVDGGSSGNFYTERKNGAAFHAFYSTDNERPRKMEEEGVRVKDARVTYANGQLVVWSSNAGLIKGEETVRSKCFKRLPSANPKPAPYGVAAMQA